MDAVLASTIDILEDVVKLPDWQLKLAFTEARHTDNLSGGIQSIDGSWRLKERVKTVSVALVLCLNVGVDPPDVVKIEPCAHLECWFDPLSDEPQKAIEHISLQLEKQYEQWHSRARYKKCLDPTVDEVKRLCTSLRRYSKEDRVLFHYNGHGVPRPTQNGEIWLFNEKYTQYMPLAIYDLQQWMGAPSIYVFDCSCAGFIVDSFLEFAKQHRRDYEIDLIHYNSLQQNQRQRLATAESVSNSSISNNKKTNDDEQQQQKQQDKEPGQHDLTSTKHPPKSHEANQNGQHLSSTQILNPQHDDTNNLATTSNQTHPAEPTNNSQTTTTPTFNNSFTQAPAHQLPSRVPPVNPPDYENCFHLAACESHQMLPMQPDVPADIFTSCLTTPIKMALRWFIQKNDLRLIPNVTLDHIDKIPGSLADRRTMLGELNWIFTAITDTIAWDVLPRELFQKLYRQDLLVASLFRNFLLADRIMRSYDCTPVSYPKLPKTYHHPMWRAWDMVVDLCLSQLVDVLEDRAPFKTSTFFAEQLTAFEVWLDMDHSSIQQPDHQLLPIILQVLLSPVHRLRALDLLSRFLNLGPGAVNSALSVGIFPYVLKLLQSNAREVRPFLLSIWAKILAVDRRCQVDLVRDSYHRYFLTILSDASYDTHYRTVAAFVMTCIVRDYPAGQEAAFQANLIAYCLEQLDESNAMLRKWLAICLGTSWDNYEDARWCGVRSCAHEKLYTILDDPDPEVRAAAVFALGTFIKSSSERTDHANAIDHSIGMKLVSTSLYDSSVLVRCELVVALQYLVVAFEGQFIKLEQANLEGDRKPNNAAEITYGTTPPSSRNNISGYISPTIQINRSTSKNLLRSHDMSHNSNNLMPGTVNLPRVSSLSSLPIVFGSGSKIVSNIYHLIWKAIYTLAADPHYKVASSAQVIIDEIRCRSFSGMSTESLKESKSNSSISESSSPNTATFSISESPPSIAGQIHNRNSSSSASRKTPTQQAQGLNETVGATTLSAVQAPLVSSSPPNRLNNQSLANHALGTANGGHQSRALTSQADRPCPTAPATASQSAPVNNKGPIFDRPAKSPSVAITRVRPHYAACRESNLSEDEKSSNVSSHRLLVMTDFVNWCTKHYIDPQNNHTSSLRNTESKEDQQREWRMLRVLSYANVCLRELQVVDPIRFSESHTSFKVSQVPNLVAVHPFDPVMVIAGKDEFSVMNMEGSHVNNYRYAADSSPLTLNSNLSSSSVPNPNTNRLATTTTIGAAGNPPSASCLNQATHPHTNGHHDNHQPHHSHPTVATQSKGNSNSSQITSLHLINPQYNTLVCTGNSDGTVRIWRAYNDTDYSFNPQLLTAFHLMPELQTHRQGLGMILLWDQNQTRFYSTSDQNDIRIVKVWDAASESKVQDIPTCAEFGVSCLASDGEHSIAAGFLDGSIRIYDTRLKKTDCRAFTFRKHSEKILNLHMYKPGEKHINLVSGDSGGEVRFWDKRAPTSVKRVDVGQRMSVMSIHPNADIFACGLKSGQGIKIYNLDGTSRAGCVIKSHQDSNFFTSRHNPSISCLAFHPLKTSLVTGYDDAVISIHSSRHGTLN